MEQKTQGKLFIAAGAVGLIISAYFLVSAFFPESNNTETWEPIQTTQSGENTISTWDEQVDFTEILIQWQNNKNINILMPRFLFTSWFESIGEEIQNKNGIGINFILIDDINIYNQLGEKRTYNEDSIDIVLVPSDVINSFTPQSKFIPIAEELSPYYHVSLSGIIDTQSYTFVPHIIDPLVIYTHRDKAYPATIDDWLQIVIGRESPKRWYFPILFGFGNQNNHFLKQWRQIMENNFFIAYHIIDYLIQWPNALQNIKTLLDIVNLTKTESWNVADFINTSNKLSDENDACKTYPSLCLFAYNYWDNHIGFLSDTNKIQLHFNNIQDYIINPFWYTDSYPARWRGFLAHKDSITSRVSMFLESYIQASLVNVNTWLRNRTIPASTLANTTINDPSIQGDLYNNNNRKIYIWEVDSLYKQIQEKNIITLLEWNYTPELFLEDFE